MSSTEALTCPSGEAYNYRNYHPRFYRVDTFSGPQRGSRSRDFKLVDSDGRVRRLSEFLDRVLVLEMGSLTCPMYAGNVARSQELMHLYPEFNFAVLFVREAHPGNRVSEHRSLSMKCENAQVAARMYGDGRTLLVDDIDGHAHEFFGQLPNSIFIIDTDGTVLFSEAWNNAPRLESVLQALRSNQDVQSLSFQMAVPPLRQIIQTLFHAGIVSVFDFVIHAPRLMWEHFRAGHFRKK
ncbi:MAG: deiodinase-like protein [Myxococcota bacterium]